MLGLAAACTAAMQALWAIGALDRGETLQTDAWHALLGHVGHDRDDVLMIRVDDATLAHPCCDDPFVFWAPVFATAIDTLRAEGASVIGIDFLLKASAEQWLASNGFDDASRTWDAPMSAALLQGGVVLVGSTVRTETGVVYDLPMGPYAALLQPNPRESIGIDNLVLDNDSVVRRFEPCPVVGGERPLVSFALALVLRHEHLPFDAESWDLGGRRVTCADGREPITWDGPSRTHKGLPLWKLVTGELSAEERAEIKGRIAIIGADHAGTTDVFATPFTPYEGGWRMPGAEVHANVVHSLLGARHVRALGPYERLLAFFIACGGLSVAMSRLSFRKSLFALAAYELVLPPLGFALFDRAAILAPATSLAIAGLLVAGGAFGIRFRREERERRFLRSVFARYVSDAVVEDILSSPQGLGLGGARRDLTVLFSDIQGFTTMSERLAPEEVVEMLNEYFGRVCRPILDHGGVVDKFIGDAVMAVFGAPVPHDDHALRAVKAALDMSKAVDEFRGWMEVRFKGRDLPPFDVGIGVHCGPAVAGNVGFERRTEYTVIGDTVNVASRVEGLTRKVGCRILVTRQVVDAIGPSLRVGREAELPVKGRDRVVSVFEVLDLEGVPDAVPAPRPPRSPSDAGS